MTWSLSERTPNAWYGLSSRTRHELCITHLVLFTNCLVHQIREGVPCRPCRSSPARQVRDRRPTNLYSSFDPNRPNGLRGRPTSRLGASCQPFWIPPSGRLQGHHRSQVERVEFERRALPGELQGCIRGGPDQVGGYQVGGAVGGQHGLQNVQGSFVSILSTFHLDKRISLCSWSIALSMWPSLLTFTVISFRTELLLLLDPLVSFPPSTLETTL